MYLFPKGFFEDQDPYLLTYLVICITGLCLGLKMWLEPQLEKFLKKIRKSSSLVTPARQPC